MTEDNRISKYIIKTYSTLRVCRKTTATVSAALNNRSLCLF
jgi:hypothetical protein